MDTPIRKHATLVGWRLLALVYDFFPALGLWFAVAAMFVAAHHDAVLGGALGLLEFSALWLVTGAYAVLSWRYGGRTLGMRPWHLRVVAVDGMPAKVPMLLRRYAIGTVSLLLAGAGFWWAWFDRDRLAWHDRLSGTRMVREAKSAAR
ncbi:MAG TPA: RDD family protein [Luteimonas sp.]|nr:RDD family protein [Luteimonas sp.]